MSLPSLKIFYYGKIYNVKFAILTPLKYTVQ